MQEYASVVWDPHQQHLKSTLEMVQSPSTRRILHDLRPTSSASDLLAQPQTENLPSRSTSDKVCTTYKIMKGLADVNPAAGLLESRHHSSRRVQIPAPSPPPHHHSRTDIPAFVLPIRRPTLEPCPCWCSVSSDSSCRRNCSDGLYGRTCLNAIRISDFSTCF